MFCRNCGKQFEGNFCPECGTQTIATPKKEIQQPELVYQSSASSNSARQNIPTYITVLCLIFFFPLGIAFMWMGKWNKVAKIIITLFWGFLSVIYIGYMGNREVEKTFIPTSEQSSTSSKIESSSQQLEKTFNEEEILSKLEVVQYNYENILDYTFLVLVVKNTSDFNLELGIDLTLKDASGKIIGAKSASKNAIESGYEVAFSFMLDEKPETVDYEITAKQEKRFECIQSDLFCEISLAKNKAVLSVTNNGNEAAEFVEYTALFFNQGEIVSSDSGYAVDDESELKSGKTIKKEADCFEEFDDVKVYFTGRR